MNGKASENPFIDKMLRGNARSDVFMSNVSTLLAGHDDASDYQKMKIVDEWASGGFQPVARDGQKTSTTNSENQGGGTV